VKKPKEASAPVAAEHKAELPFTLDEEGYAVYRLERDTVLATAFAIDCGGNLANIDETIHEIPDDKPVKKWMLELRQEARDHWMVGAQGCELSFAKLTILNERMLAIRREQQLLPLAKTFRKISKANSGNAQRSRPKQLDKGITLDDVLRSLAGREEPAKALWNALYGELDALHCSVHADEKSPDITKHKYTFGLANGKSSTITFGHFQNLLTQFREQKSD
jgi:hypothetical protein